MVWKSVFIAALLFLAGASRAEAQRYRPTTYPVFYVNETLGNDSNSCLLPGTGACRTFNGAFNVACSTIDSDGLYVTLQGDPGQVFTVPFNLIQGNTSSGPGEAQPQPACVGFNQMILDLGGSTLSTAGTAIFIRGFPIWLTVQNGTITSPTVGNDVECYGGGVTVELAGTSLTFGKTNTNYAQLSATRRCRIVTRVGATVTFTGGGASAAQAIIGGGIELEAPIVFAGSPVYSQAIYQATDNSYITLYGATQTGTPVGPQWQIATGGVIDTFGQTGTRVPAAGYNANNYLPGTAPGYYGIGGGTFDNPRTPSVRSCGTPAQIVGTDRSGYVVLGTGAATTCSLNFTTLTGFICTVSTNKLSAPADVIAIGPSGQTSGSTPGYILFHYASNTGQTIAWHCEPPQI